MGDRTFSEADRGPTMVVEILPEVWALFLRGIWQREMPTEPGHYPTADYLGEPGAFITVYLDPETKHSTPSDSWGGWWWSVPLPDMPQAPLLHGPDEDPPSDPEPEIDWSVDDPHFGTLRWQDQIYRVRVDPTTHDFWLECDKRPDGLGPTKVEFELTWLLVRPLIEAVFPPLPPLPLESP